MKGKHTLKKRPRNARPHPSRSTPLPPAHNHKPLYLPDVDEGPDAAYREAIELIARGGRIRGRAL
jgi:hypothetical protein